MKRLKEIYDEFTDILNYKSQIKLLNKRVKELEREPQLLIDKMNIMKIEIRELKLENKYLLKEVKKYERIHND